MKLDILAIAAHPDDVELSCAGTLMVHAAQGMKVGVADITRGELGTRGTPETRATEAKAAAALMGLAVRDNLELADGFFKNERMGPAGLIRRSICHLKREFGTGSNKIPQGSCL